MVQNYISKLISEEALPEGFHHTVSRWYSPLAESIVKQGSVSKENNTPFVLGVQGTQGSGKSTLAAFLKAILENEYGLKTVSLSLDDFYLTHAERSILGKEVHPLFVTRGVPGTHDTQLTIDTIEALKTLDSGNTVEIPRFNKAIDDRFDKNNWGQVSDSIDVIIFEGWCVGCTPEQEEALEKPVNEFEKREDPEGIWRRYANGKLANEYQTLFSLLDKLVVINAPSFDCVFEWRMLQEQKLKEKWLSNADKSKSNIMSEAEVIRFISHYERLTRHCLATLPSQADWLLPLNKHHEIQDLIEKK